MVPEITVSGLAASGAIPDRPMLLCVISSDPELAAACGSQLEHLCPAGYSITQCQGPSEVPYGCDIYVWDYASCPALPSAMAAKSPAAKLVIVEKGSLLDTQRNLPCQDLSFVDKPVTSLSLRVVLGSALARLQLRSVAKSSTDLNFDRDVLLQRLLEANLKLHEYDQDRSNFLTRAIHDIRVPLMAIQGYCDLLLAGQMGSIHHEQAQILGRMRRSVTRLRRIAEAVMGLGGGAQTNTQPKFENADLEACVQQAVHEMLPFLEKKRITLDVELEPQSAPLWLDPSQMEQVLVNLLDNGCKFTPKGGSITIRGSSVTAEQSRAVGAPKVSAVYRLDISDTGPGISPDILERIFDEYTSYGDPLDRSGSGLGLAICRMIVEAHHGQIWASSDNQGATFSLLLPMAQSFNDLSHTKI